MVNQGKKLNPIIYLSIFGVLTAITLNIPGGFYILYPFMILGTWFHEISHGLTALILGGDFHKLVIFADGSGYAQFSYSSLFMGNIGNALVAAAGPLGPTIFGNILMLGSINDKVTKFIMYGLSFAMLLSSILWVRPIFGFGFGFTILFSLIFLFVAFKTNIKTQKLTLQFIAIQAFMSLYMSINYLFSKNAIVGGNHNMSDTEVIADNLFLPNWFWGALILIISLIIIAKSILFIIKKESNSSNNDYINQRIN